MSADKYSTPRSPNVPEPAALTAQISRTFQEIYQLIHLLRENSLHSVVGENHLFEEADGPCAFQAAGQFERPREFLQAMLDLVRIIYEPDPPGTFFLNSNIDFLFDGVVHDPFRLGYLSLLSLPGESFTDFHARAVEPKLRSLGYAGVKAHATYLMITVGMFRWKFPQQIRREVHAIYQDGFTLDELIPRFAQVAQGLPLRAFDSGKSFAGNSHDDAIGIDRVRLSVWIYLPMKSHA